MASRSAGTRECHNLAINRFSVGTIRVADRDTIIKRIQGGVGVSVKRRMQSVMHVKHAWWDDKH